MAFMRGASLALAVILACLAACGGGGGGDDAGWLYPLWVPTDVVVADLDGDGRNDVLTLGQYAASASQREGRLIVHRQVSAGVFAQAETFIVGLYPWRLAVRDLDGDGNIDAVVADVDERTVWLLLQDPAVPGRFQAPHRVASDITAYDVAIADLDDDGVPDLAIPDARSGSGRLLLLYQDANRRGTFVAQTDLVVPGTAASAVASADLDGDERADLAMVIATPGGGTVPRGMVAYSLQQPDGSMGPVTTLAPKTGLNPRRLAIADYDGDGRRDIFVYYTPYSADYLATLTVLLHDPAAMSFQPPVDTPAVGTRGVDDAVFADLDDDGRPDAALTGFFPVGSPSTVESRVNRYTQSGNGAFAPTSSASLPFAASRITAGDLDGDRRNEIVVHGADASYLVLD